MGPTLSSPSCLLCTFTTPRLTHDTTTTFIATMSQLIQITEWMHKSVTDIVKNLTQTPLLVQIHADGEVKTNKASSENGWKLRRRLKESFSWKNSPDKPIRNIPANIPTELSFWRGKWTDRMMERMTSKSRCYLLKTCRSELLETRLKWFAGPNW